MRPATLLSGHWVVARPYTPGVVKRGQSEAGRLSEHCSRWRVAPPGALRSPRPRKTHVLHPLRARHPTISAIASGHGPLELPRRVHLQRAALPSALAFFFSRHTVASVVRYAALTACLPGLGQALECRPPCDASAPWIAGRLPTSL